MNCITWYTVKHFWRWTRKSRGGLQLSWVNYKVFCNYREIPSNCTFDEPSSYMLLITDSPIKLTNLYLCTELSDAIYLPQSQGPTGWKRMNVWLGLAAGRIGPNPSELPPLNPNSIINQFDQIEEQYKGYIFSCVCEHQLFLNSCGCEEVFDLKTSSHPHENIFFGENVFVCVRVCVCVCVCVWVSGLDRPRWVYLGHTCSHTWPQVDLSRPGMHIFCIIFFSCVCEEVFRPKTSSHTHTIKKVGVHTQRKNKL